MIKSERFMELGGNRFYRTWEQYYIVLGEELTMSSFTSPLVVKHLNGKNWEVVRAFTYHIGDRYATEKITVPVGFLTDFASIPKSVWSLIGHPTGRYGKAAVVHDYVYRTSCLKYTRKQADQIFLEGMKVLEVGYLKRYSIYWAVRSFGWTSFKRRK